MPFQYQQFQNPYVQTIGDLMRAGPDAQARAAQAIGQAQAQGALQAGNAWAGGIQTLGHAIASVPGEIQQVRLQAQQDTMRDLQIAQAKREATAADRVEATRRQVNGFMNDPDVVNADGTFNLQGMAKKMSQGLPGGAVGPTEPPDMGTLTSLLDPINASIRQAQASKQQYEAHQATALGDMAKGLLAQGGASGNYLPFAPVALAAAVKSGLMSEAQRDQFMRQLVEEPNEAHQTLQLLAQKATPEETQIVPEGATVVSKRTNLPTFAAPGKPPTEAELALRAAGGDVKAQGAMGLLKPGPRVEPPKAGSLEDAVDRARRLAVAANGGVALSDQQIQAVDAKAMQTYKEQNADPELRAAALAQKNIATSLAQLQLNQMPSKEQATSVADDLVNHRISPDQLATLFSTRGREGLAFKLAVTSEAKKLDPTFNFEEAASTYALAKSPGFQNTVRYMDSVQESMPRLLASAQTLNNGNVRSINELLNAGKNQVNNVDLKRFKTDALLVGDEVAKILSGGGTGSATSDAKLKQGVDLLGQADSPAAIATAVQEIQALIGYRRQALTRGTYMEGTTAARPGAAPVAAPVLPPVAPGMIRAFDPSGQPHDAPAGTPLPAGWTMRR